jgi:hypothetical protein
MVNTLEHPTMKPDTPQPGYHILAEIGLCLSTVSALERSSGRTAPTSQAALGNIQKPTSHAGTNNAPESQRFLLYN